MNDSIAGAAAVLLAERFEPHPYLIYWCGTIKPAHRYGHLFEGLLPISREPSISISTDFLQVRERGTSLQRLVSRGGRIIVELFGVEHQLAVSGIEPHVVSYDMKEVNEAHTHGGRLFVDYVYK